MAHLRTYENATRTKRIWYNPYEKVWVLQTLDADGNQIGNADYTCDGDYADKWLDDVLQS